MRYIETAQRLMQDSRRASQQTLDNWRLEDDDDSSTDSEEEEASIVRTENRAVLGIDPVPIRQHQTSILEFYLATTRATASINGESRTSLSNSSSSSDGDSVSSSSSENDFQVQPPAGARPLVGLLPSAKWNNRTT